MEFMAMHSVADEGIGPYRVTNPGHFLFHKPHRVGLRKGDTFGLRPGSRLPAVVGHECDVRISTLARICVEPLPEGATQPREDPPGIVVLAEGMADWARVKLGAPLDYFMRPVVEPGARAALDFAAEMIYWERPDGGRVFNAGSVCAGRGFGNDPKFALLVKNVLHHFGVEPGAKRPEDRP
jgi:N,N-dimethylformamidase